MWDSYKFISHSKGHSVAYSNEIYVRITIPTYLIILRFYRFKKIYLKILILLSLPRLPSVIPTETVFSSWIPIMLSFHPYKHDFNMLFFWHNFVIFKWLPILCRKSVKLLKPFNILYELNFFDSRSLINFKFTHTRRALRKIFKDYQTFTLNWQSLNCKR